MRFYDVRFIVFLLVLTLACSSPKFNIDHANTISQEDRLDQIRTLEKSVLKIICTAYYENYYYNRPANLNANICSNSLVSVFSGILCNLIDFWR